MKFKITFVLAFLFTSLLGVYAQEKPSTYQEYSKQARIAFGDKRYADCAIFLEKAIKLQEPVAQDHFNLACCLSMAGRSKEAFKELHHAIDKGYVKLKYLSENPNLKPLHVHDEWNPLIEKMKKSIAAYEAKLDKVFRGEIIKLFHTQKDFTAFCDSLFWRLPANHIDSLYGEQIKKSKKSISEEFDSIIRKYGWPKKTTTGEDGAYAGFYLIQRVTPKLREKYMPLMAEAAKTGEAILSNVAVVYDQMMKDKDLPQKYATQVFVNDLGDYELYKVANIEKVPEYRKLAGLSPIEEYLAKFKIKWPPVVEKE